MRRTQDHPAGSARVLRTWTILAGGREIIHLDDYEACGSVTKSREAFPSITGSVGHHVSGTHCYGPGMEDSHLAPLYEGGCQGPLDADAFNDATTLSMVRRCPGRRPFMVILKAGNVEARFGKWLIAIVDVRGQVGRPGVKGGQCPAPSPPEPLP